MPSFDAVEGRGAIPATGKASMDSALIVAVEEYGPSRWVGASAAGLLWERFFTQSLGIPAQKVIRLHSLQTGADRLRAELERVAALSGAGGHAWFVFIGLAGKDPARKAPQEGVLAGFSAFSPNNRSPWRARGLSNAEIAGVLGAGKGAPIVVVDAAIDASVRTLVGGGAWSATTEAVALPAAGRGVVLGRIARNDVPHTYPGTVIPALSYLLVGALRGWADFDHDGQVTADEAWRYTRERLTSLGSDVGESRAQRPDKRRDEVLSRGAEPEPAFVPTGSSTRAAEAALFNRHGLILPALPEQPHHVPGDWEDKGYRARCHPKGWAPGDVPAEETAGDVDGAYQRCSGGTSVGLWAEAWCEQGGDPCGNRFALKANDLCTLLTRYGEQKKRIVHALAADWPVVDAALARATDPQERRRILTTFRDQYPMLSALGLEGELERTCVRHVQGRASMARRSLPAGAQWIPIEGGAFARGQPHPYVRRVDLHNTSQARRLLDDGPVDSVLIGGFDMLETEVTVAQYRACVDHGRCTPPRSNRATVHQNAEASGHENHPVNYVDWAQADTFCEWIGGRLPSETEWDYAATSRGRYANPWGDHDTCEGVVKFQVYDAEGRCGDEDAGTSPVCSRPSGNSRQGVCDLLGNVWEWVADEVHPNYCGAPGDGSAWTGGSTGAEAGRRMIRGGSWHDEYALVGLRVSAPADRGDMDLGFRCVRDGAGGLADGAGRGQHP